MKKNLLKAIILFSMVLICIDTKAQSFDEYETFEEGWIKPFIRYSLT
ncbi:MAG: hypothetical protein KJ712_07900 [Bacteroidetes bacterium]|nr:hypothetical protein [Bacteroidota bacterium]MBU1486368.1 hypothetical protein [Bacteroidota bacterium]MBU2046637.1 hypothetical protein [Bacteroidota bacterium]MBU2268930.1 hypothetical protein [Bacteroidota bacterium]MBU2377425.1 hypothetical protein [Bacteroidota bacterium]